MDQGTPKTPADALAFGLVDRVVAPERLLEEAVEHATRLGRRPKAGIGAVKRAVRFGGSLPLEDGLRLEAGEFLSAMSTPESIEAQRAYVDRTNELGECRSPTPISARPSSNAEGSSDRKPTTRLLHVNDRTAVIAYTSASCIGESRYWDSTCKQSVLRTFGTIICSRRSGVGATNNYAMARLFVESPRTGRLD